MKTQALYIPAIAFAVALGGFLMGFDASVISGAIRFITIEFALSPAEQGFAVASLTLTASIGMMSAGPLADLLGRKKVAILAACLFLLSALYSATAVSYVHFVIARMIGGLGVGAALIIPPMYIAEIAPPKLRGRLVSLNQLNIVIGLSAAFFSNYFILQLQNSETEWIQALNPASNSWRWMLGLEALPALVYIAILPLVPESPRWLAIQGRKDDARKVLHRIENAENVEKRMAAIEALATGKDRTKTPVKALFATAMHRVLIIGVGIAIIQQITGINAVFFYAPMIFEQTGIGTDASFANAAIIGLANLVFTLLAIAFVDKVGRKPLLGIGLAGIAVSMFTLAASFNAAEYRITEKSLTSLAQHDNYAEFRQIETLANHQFVNDVELKKALAETLGKATAQKYESLILPEAIKINAWVVLIAIVSFIASFALSLGPVMWILLSELFPDRLRGLAISFVGLINSSVSFMVQQLFPWQLAELGSSITFLCYGIFAVIGWLFVMARLPETKGKSLEELERELLD